VSVAVEEPEGLEHGQADDALGARLEAQDMALRGLLSFSILWGANMEVQHVAIGVVVGVVEDQRPIVTGTASIASGPFRVATAVMIRPGC